MPLGCPLSLLSCKGFRDLRAVRGNRWLWRLFTILLNISVVYDKDVITHIFGMIRLQAGRPSLHCTGRPNYFFQKELSFLLKQATSIKYKKGKQYTQ